jgi:4-amino-4-deoxy-L-arabinose transferase-like glycosyltransferase
MAVTPINVVMDRHNNPDTTLVLCLTVAAYFLIKSVETGRLSPLVWSAVWTGLAFNTKMLQGLMAVPALGLAVLVGSPRSFKVRVGHLAVAGVVLAAVCASWILFFDLTPAHDRPFAGGTQTGTMRELVFGYNGFGRVQGGAGNFSAPQGARGPGGGMAGLPGPFGMGTPGWLRFASPHLAAQMLWFLPLTIVGCLLAAARHRLSVPLSIEHSALVLFGGWFLVNIAVLSFARGIVHTYYTSMLGPPLAVLSGLAVSELWRFARKAPGGPILLFAALVLTAGWQWRLLGNDQWLTPLEGVPLLGSVAALIGLVPMVKPFAPTAIYAVAILGLLASPAVWSVHAVFTKASGTLPEAGLGAAGLPGMDPDASSAGQEGLLNYLRAHRTGERILLAAASTQLTAPIIIESGETAVSMGGFLGSDPAVPMDRFEQLVHNKELRFILGSPMDMMGANGKRMDWIRENCDIVPNREWQDSARSGPARGFGMAGVAVLYDCKVS